jgi:PAS domain S-box-containing protein
VIASPAHRKAFTEQLTLHGADLRGAVRENRLVFLDAERTLARFMADGRPGWVPFESTIGDAVRGIRPGRATGLRAYGDMVGVLWEMGNCSAAVRLEEFWNRLLGTIGFRLYCGCPIDVFGEEFQTSLIDDLLCAHTHLVPSGPNGDMESALDRAMYEVLGPPAESAPAPANGNGRRARAVIPSAEARILSLRTDSPEHAHEVLARAREHYQAEKRFRALIENSSDAICLTDAHGNVIYASASNHKVLGYEPHELLGRNAVEFIHPEDLERFKRATKNVLVVPHTPTRVEARVIRKDGGWSWVESTSSNLLDEPDIRAIVSNYRDISERKAAEDRMQRNAEQLARSNAELEAFAYVAAHDLKEPLRTIQAFTQLLIQKTAADDETRQVAGFIVDGVNRMSVLLEDLLSFTSLSFNDPSRPVELQRAVKRAIRNLEGAVRENGAKLTAERLPVVQGNETNLVQVLQNLIGNALKYRSEAPPEIHISAEPLGHEWVVRIRDNGIGIAPEYRDRVFGLFKRLHSRDVPGSGIGLAICKKIVEEGGGKIWVESELGKGSTFCFTVPACRDAAKANFS